MEQGKYLEKSSTRFTVTQKDYDELVANPKRGLKLIIKPIKGEHPRGVYMLPNKVARSFIEKKQEWPNWDKHQDFKQDGIPSALKGYFTENNKNIYTEAEPRKGRVDLKEKVAADVNPVVKLERQKYFEKQRRDWSDREIQMAILYAQQIIIEKTDKVRGNTNTMIWWLIAIPIMLAVFWILSMIF